MKRKPKPKTGKLTAAIHQLAIAADQFQAKRFNKPPPARYRRINPNSPEGKAIAARYITPA